MKSLVVLCAAVGLLLVPVVRADYVQPPDQWEGIYSSSQYPQVIADDVTPGEDGPVTTITWYGLYDDNVQPMPGVETFTMRFFDDASGLPGTLVWEENSPVNGIATGNTVSGAYDEYEFTFNAAAPFGVSSGTTVWLSIFSDDVNYCWETSNNVAGNDVAFTVTDPFLAGWGAGGTTYDAAMHLVIVPEPGTLFLLGLGGIGLALYRRRKK